MAKTINKEMRIRGQGNYKTIFVEEKEKDKVKIEDINRQLSKLDRQILKLQNDYENLLFEKTKIVTRYENGDTENAHN